MYCVCLFIILHVCIDYFCPCVASAVSHHVSVTAIRFSLYDLMCLFSPQGTPERLIMHLVEEPSVVDPTYIEDFLLTYRTFLSSPMEVGKKLLEWFQVDSLRDTVRIFLHFLSFFKTNEIVFVIHV